MDAGKGSLQMENRGEKGAAAAKLYDGSGGRSKIVVKKDVDVRSNRDNYERALNGDIV